ncbi:hypothetical protein R1sor_018939 [Riccia sorocarpa]|uniref:NB-ARC domain-containing protein n=1 Tax=Riccia sorocarpa TaxID=122646 RepID=A0ABD3IFB4_9MARC
MTQEFLDGQGIGSMSANEGLLIFAKELSTGAARLHEEFLNVRKKYEWKIFGVGESCVPAGAGSSPIVKEASSRDGDEFFLVQSDHFSISRPEDRKSTAYLQLVKLIKTACGKKEKKGKRASSRIVGVDSLLSALIGYLEQHTFLGLWGMGGVGKTTMAKLLFEELEEEFEYTCFMEELKLITGSKDDVKGKIWTKMRRYGKPIAKPCTWDDLRGEKLLMVLDDIDRDKHVDLTLDIAKGNAMRGSRYIATSRDMGLLKWLDEPQCGKTHIFEIPLLSDEDAKRLFYSYAFPNGENPPETLGGIVDEIVRVCAGLPLTLKVLGTHLRAERDERSWAEIPSALETAQSISSLEERIWAVLRVSYDALQDDEKGLFLEMACTFTRDDHRFTNDEIKWALDSKYKNVNNLLKALVEKCLIKVGDGRPPGSDPLQVDDPFQMHEHLRSMGYKIVKHLGKCVEHLIYQLGEENQSILDENISPQEIATLSVACAEGGSLSPCQLALLLSIQAALPDMTGLRYLDLELGFRKAMYLRAHSGLQGEFEDETEIVDRRFQELFPNGILSLPSSAVMARFDGYSWELNFKSETIRFEKLVVLELIIIDSWPSDFLSAAVCERLPALKFLRVKCWEPIQSVGIAFEKLGKLQHLSLGFENSANGALLPGSFRYLSSLKYLGLWCISFPDTVDNWSRLEQLKIGGCLDLVELPETFGNLSRLRHLTIRSCDSLMELPETCGKLSNLKHLEINWCKSLQKLPDMFGNLRSLEYLEIGSCDHLQKLPDTFGNLSSLKHLEIRSCNHLRKLPDTFGSLSRLQYLRMEGLPLEELPASFGNLSGLQHLAVINLHLRYLPDSFRSLSALKLLWIEACSRLQDFAEMLEKFYNLKDLYLTHSPNLSVLYIHFGSFTSLEKVTLCGCWSPHEEELRKRFANSRAVLKFDSFWCGRQESSI